MHSFFMDLECAREHLLNCHLDGCACCCVLVAKVGESILARVLVHIGQFDRWLELVFELLIQIRLDEFLEHSVFAR